MTVLKGKPKGGNPHARIDEGKIASVATPRRRSLFCKRTTLILCTLTIAWNSFASKWSSSDGTHTWWYDSSSAHIIITGVWPAEGALTIPNDVTSIGDSAFSSTDLTSVTIGNKVTNIGKGAFKFCRRLTSVMIGNSVTNIGEGAFEDCSGLTSVTIPNSVTSVGEDAFRDCSGLVNVTIGNSVTHIGKGAFKDCSGLTSVTIPNNVTSIGEDVFQDCSGLVNVTIGNNVTHIGKGTFKDCSGLTSVTIPNSVTSIEEDAFWDCSSLASVTIPGGVTKIGDWAFVGCCSLVRMTIPNSVTNIGNGAFKRCRGLTSVILPDKTKSIGKSAFEDCSGLTSMTIPNSVTSVGEDAFRDCSGLVNVSIGNSVTSIGDYAFHGCSGLKSVTIPDSVTNIGNSAFLGCSGLKSVTIPGGVTTIGDFAFYGCSKLTDVTIQNGVKCIGSWTFRCTGLTSVTIPSSVTNIDEFAFDESVRVIREKETSKQSGLLSTSSEKPSSSDSFCDRISNAGRTGGGVLLLLIIIGGEGWFVRRFVWARSQSNEDNPNPNEGKPGGITGTNLGLKTSGCEGRKLSGSSASFFSFDGRAAQKPFCLALLISHIFTIPLLLISPSAILIPYGCTLPIRLRRLHDCDMPRRLAFIFISQLILVLLIAALDYAGVISAEEAIVKIAFLVYFLLSEALQVVFLGCCKGTPGPNRFGDIPVTLGPYEEHPTWKSWRGRMPRGTYLLFSWVLFPLFAVGSVLATFGMAFILGYGVATILIIVIPWLAIIRLGADVRRFHDLGLSGWWLLIFLVTQVVLLFGIVALLMMVKGAWTWQGAFEVLKEFHVWLEGLFGVINFVVFVCFSGTQGPNRFGPDPRGRLGKSVKTGELSYLAQRTKKLQELRKMKESGRITESEYEDKLDQILGGAGMSE